jgi:hypothetical protein
MIGSIRQTVVVERDGIRVRYMNFPAIGKRPQGLEG